MSDRVSATASEAQRSGTTTPPPNTAPGPQQSGAPTRCGDIVIALDVGGTGMKCALVRPDGTVLHAERHPTPAAQGSDAVTATILEVGAALAGRARAEGLTPIAAGVVVPGVVNEGSGIAVWSSNLGFRDVPLRDLLAARLDLPAVLGHDVRAGGLAEARLGAGRGERHVLFVAIGTGIAAAHVVDGRVFAGANGAAGELGHIVVRPGGPPCGCGARGCLESVASAAAIGRRYAELSGRTGATAADVAARAAGGPSVAATVWEDALAALADGLLTAQALLDVGTIVLGGGLAEAGDTLFSPLRAALEQRVTFHRPPRLVPAALGDTSSCLGAALLATDSVTRS